MTRLAAHRGGARLWPENSLRAFRESLALGADLVELDVHLAADGALAVIHAGPRRRTTARLGRVRPRRAAELRRARLRGPDRRLTAEHVPMLEDALAIVAEGGGGVLVEVKAPGRGLGVRYFPRSRIRPGARYQGLEERAVAALSSAKLLERANLMSFNPAVIERARTLAPRLSTTLLVSAMHVRLARARRAGTAHRRASWRGTALAREQPRRVPRRHRARRGRARVRRPPDRGWRARRHPRSHARSHHHGARARARGDARRALDRAAARRNRRADGRARADAGPGPRSRGAVEGRGPAGDQATGQRRSLRRSRGARARGPCRARSLAASGRAVLRPGHAGARARADAVGANDAAREPNAPGCRGHQRGGRRAPGRRRRDDRRRHRPPPRGRARRRGRTGCPRAPLGLDRERGGRPAAHAHIGRRCRDDRPPGPGAPAIRETLTRSA